MLLFCVVSLALGLGTLVLTRKLSWSARIAIAAVVSVAVPAAMFFWVLAVGDEPLPGEKTVAPPPSHQVEPSGGQGREQR
jgi:hypothetical protein